MREKRLCFNSHLFFAVFLTFGTNFIASAIDCDHFVDIYGGIITYDPLDNGISLPDGSIATLTCSEEAFETTSTCTNGNWNPPSLGTCGKAVSINYTPAVVTYAPPAKRADGDAGAGGSYAAMASEATSNNCAPLTAPANSFISYNYFGLAPYPSSTMAILNCHLGYAPVGMTAAECEGGSWTTIGSCQSASIQRCPPVLPVMNGIINYIPGGNGAYDYGSVAELSCGFGYSVSGNPQVTCESTGWVPASGLGQCHEGLGTTSSGISCPALSVLNGQVSYMQANAAIPYSSGTTAILLCNSGYTLSGSSTTSYCSNGVWSPSLGQCAFTSGMSGITSSFGITQSGIGTTSTIGTCPPMFAFIMNGQITYSTTASMLGTYNSGTVASLSCYSGSSASGSQTATCANGVWSPTSLGSCVSGGLGSMTTGIYGSTTASCISLGSIFNGQISYSTASTGLSQYPTGSTATLTCTSGIPTGTTTSTCSNGIWTPTLGTCSSTGLGTGLGSTGTSCYIAVVSLSGGTVSYSNGLTIGPWTPGSVATLTCPSGYPLGQSTASCINGAWSPSSFQGCSTTSTTGIGSNLVGTGTAQCYIGVMSLAGGTVAYSNGLTTGPWTTGATASLTCPSGTPLGQSTASCINGVWSPSSFQGCSTTGLTSSTGTLGGSTATGTPCYIAVVSLSGGTISYSTGNNLGPWNSGTTATLTCSSGFPNGQSTAICSNGQFSPNTLQGCSTTGLSTIGTGVSANAASCYLPMAAVIGGTISYSTGSTIPPFPAGSTASLVCTNGIASGQTTASCLNGIWSPSSFTGCQNTGLGTNNWGIGTSASTAQCYATLIAPFNGQIQYSTGSTFGPFPTGSTAFLTCNNGYSVSGTSTATCYGGQFSPSTLGTCVYGLSTGTSTSNGLTALSAREKLPQNCEKAPLPLISNGKLILTDGIESGSKAVSESATKDRIHTAIVECNDNFTPSVNNVTVYCYQSNWRLKETPKCESPEDKKACLTAPVLHVSRGQILYSTGQHDGPYDVGTVATLICEFGTTAVGGASSATCTDGGWSQEMATCRTASTSSTSKHCDQLADVAYGNIVYSEIFNHNGPFDENTYATLNCDLGSSPIGAITSVCHNGSWTPSIGSCRSPVTPSVTIPEGNNPGRPIDARVITGGGGVFARAHPTSNTHSTSIRCSPIKSVSLTATLKFDQVPLADGLYPNTTIVRLICLEEGANVLNGVTEAECFNGRWLPELGECKKEDDEGHSDTDSTSEAPFKLIGTCQPLMPPEKGVISYIHSGKTNNYQAGSTAILNCELGYSVSGFAALSCASNGAWLPTRGFGKCIENEDLVH